MRIKWISHFPNPEEISRNKYYEYKIEGETAFVYGDGLIIDYPIELFKQLFSPEVGEWKDIFKVEKIVSK